MNSIFAYSVKKHRHMSEMDQEFNKINRSRIEYTFNPHLLPTFRGLLSTIHVVLKKNTNAKKVLKEIKKFHKRNKFVKILKMNKEIGTGNVINTNYCEISVCETRYKNRIKIFSAIDNLIKGASGQAIQNMNLLYGFDEATGLKMKNLLIFSFVLLISCSTNVKKVHMCGDRECVDRKEADEYFSRTLVSEIKILNNKEKKESDLIELNIIKDNENNKGIIKNTSNKRLIKDKLAQQKKLERMRIKKQRKNCN